ncbi:hypothetical protein BRADI_2g16555v3 [Brachypodium distachyon]|uniref:Uncharacterized protein n=1 Tax=Brachypodium distachyon TaxID=15368 RepID=A0A2K2D8U7_BRADI|nr:hypothetical protein BRADI_2g16555v3 [Brachypodium distachyon]
MAGEVLLPAPFVRQFRSAKTGPCHKCFDCFFSLDSHRLVENTEPRLNFGEKPTDEFDAQSNRAAGVKHSHPCLPGTSAFVTESVKPAQWVAT